MAFSRVKLPPEVRTPFDVYVNGVRQVEGRDYRVAGHELRFDRPLAQEGKLGFWRWTIGAIGIGTYRANETVDVRHEVDGHPRVAHALPVEAVDGAESAPPRAGRARPSRRPG